MEKIVAYINDPAWWFSAFFIAIITSVVAGFAKDQIGRWLGKLSNSARELQQRRSEQREKVISALAENEGFLIIAMVRATWMVLVTLGTITLFFLSPMWSDLVKFWCTTVHSNASCMLGTEILPVGASAGLGLLSIALAYVTSSVVQMTMHGYRAYLKKRGFPSVG